MSTSGPVAARRVLVTGGAGGIGVHLVRALRARGSEVVVVDNFSSSRPEALAPFSSDPQVKVVRQDVTDLEGLHPHFEGIDFVWHLSANPDVRRGAAETDLDLVQGTVATRNVLEAMRRHGVRHLGFSSSSVVYGHPKTLPTPEEYAPLLPESLYGASKLGGEGLVSAFCHTFGLRSWIFRFANVVGPGATHGVIYDFLVKLQKDPLHLEVLGDGRQRKGYLDVEDCVSAMLHTLGHGPSEVNVYNLAPVDTISVAEIALRVLEITGSKAEVIYTGGERGWPGDVPQQHLAIDRLLATGFRPRYTSREVVDRAIRVLHREMTG